MKGHFIIFSSWVELATHSQQLVPGANAPALGVVRSPLHLLHARKCNGSLALWIKAVSVACSLCHLLHHEAGWRALCCIAWACYMSGAHEFVWTKIWWTYVLQPAGATLNQIQPDAA